jgi:hypothetical protein
MITMCFSVRLNDLNEKTGNPNPSTDNVMDDNTHVGLLYTIPGTRSHECRPKDQ